MLEVVRARLAQSPEGFDIAIKTLDGTAGNVELFAADELGIAVRNGKEIRCYPWTAITRIRYPG